MKLRTRQSTAAVAPARERARPRPASASSRGVQKRQIARKPCVGVARAARAVRKPAPGQVAKRAVDPKEQQEMEEKVSYEESVHEVAAERSNDDKETEDEKKEEGDDDDGDDDDEEKKMKTIDDLPEEIMLGIFSYFRPPQLCWKIGRVCRRWAAWSVAPILWKSRDFILSATPGSGSRRKK